ncbi:replication protein A 70 kDa DNA-binding subunit E-like [Silene latifolia]|uniref:replication protein A 70 kDa DNA-binding subunit E-like n=1 Tax=Silene latifolia TaxID=37657 RepID=UPI003D784A57
MLGELYTLYIQLFLYFKFHTPTIPSELPTTMAPSKSSSNSTINELNERKTSGKIKARVSRLWEVTNPYVAGQLICIDMVLIDEEGGYVHAAIYGNSLIERFRSSLTEGDVYVMNHFAIEPNKSPYRVVSDSKIMLKFQFSTYIKKITSESCTIPRHRFDFVSFKTLEQLRLKPEVLTGWLVKMQTHYLTPIQNRIPHLRTMISSQAYFEIILKKKHLRSK